jgi:hypothetical protein
MCGDRFGIGQLRLIQRLRLVSNTAGSPRTQLPL